MINLFRAMTNVTTLSIDFDVLHITDVFTALTFRGGYDEILLPKLDTISVRALMTPSSEASSALAALLKMAASRSPGDAGALGVVLLREVLLSTADNPISLRVDFNAVLEQWSYKTKMP